MRDADIKEFAYSLRQKLLTDKFGGWEKLDQRFLEDLCDRIADEVKDFILEQDHYECETEIKFLNQTVDNVEQRERKLEQTNNTLTSGLKDLLEKVRL